MRNQVNNKRKEQVETYPSALDLLRPVLPPDTKAWEKARLAFLAEAREFSAEAVTSVRESRRNEWRMRLPAFLSFKWRDKAMMVTVKILLALALVVGGGSGTVYAMQNSLPGSPLYELKLNVEDIRLANANDAEARIERAMAMAQNRVEEALRLAGKGDEVPVQVAERLEQHLASAMAAAEELPESAQARARLADELGKQLQVMEQVRNRLQEAGKGENAEGAIAMVQVMQQTRQHLCADQGTPAAEEEPIQEQEMQRQQEQQMMGEPDQDQEQLQSLQQSQQDEPVQNQQPQQTPQQEQLQDQQQTQQQQQLEEKQQESQEHLQSEQPQQTQSQTQTQTQDQELQPDETPPASRGRMGQQE